MEYIYKLDKNYLDWKKVSSRIHFYYPAILNIKPNDIVYFLVAAELDEATCLLVEVTKIDLKGIQYYNETLQYLDSSLMMTLEQTFLEFKVLKKSFHQELHIYNLQKNGYFFEATNLIKRIGKHIKFFEQIESFIDEDSKLESKIFPIEKEILSYDRQKQDSLYAMIKIFVSQLDKMSFEEYRMFYLSSKEIGFLTDLFYDEKNNIWYSNDEVIDFPEIFFNIFKKKFLKEKKYITVLAQISLAVKTDEINLYILNPSTLVKLAVYLGVQEYVRNLYELNEKVYNALIEIFPNFPTYDKKAFSRSIDEWSKTIELSKTQIKEVDELISEFQMLIPESPFIQRNNQGLLGKEFEENCFYILKNNHSVCVELPHSFQTNYLVEQMMYLFNFSASDSYFIDMTKLKEESNLKPYKRFFGLDIIDLTEKQHTSFNNNVIMIYHLKIEQFNIHTHITYHVDFVPNHSELTLDMLKIQLQKYEFNEYEMNKLIDIFNQFNKDLPFRYHLPTHYFYSYPWDNGLNFNHNLDIILKNRLNPLKNKLKSQLLKEISNEN